MKNFSKTYALRNYFLNRMAGNISFPKTNIGRTIFLDNGHEAEIFRQVIFEGPPVDDTKTVLFHVKFHLKGMSPEINKIFSHIPIPLFVGLPGFCAKFWCMDRSTDDCHGFYKWQSRDHAEEYVRSFAMKFMSGRSIPESIASEILSYRGNRYHAYPDAP